MWFYYLFVGLITNRFFRQRQVLYILYIGLPILKLESAHNSKWLRLRHNYTANDPTSCRKLD